MTGRHVVVRTIERAAPAVVDELGTVGTATVHEAIGRRGYIGPQLRPIQHGVRLAGSAVTVESPPGDNLMVHAAVEMCQAGDVLVVATTEPSPHGVLGELLATSLMARGVRALVTDAGVRDTAELRELGFAVWSQFVSCEGTIKATPGSVNIPVVLGQQVVAAGDVICADDDGVVVVPRDDAARALGRSRERLDREGSTRSRLATGELGVDIYGLRSKLEEVGVEYVEHIDDVEPG